MAGKIDNRLFIEHTGYISVKFFDLKAEKRFYSRGIVLDFISTALTLITGEIRTEVNEQIEAKKWEILRCFFYEDEGVVEVRKIQQKSLFI